MTRDQNIDTFLSAYDKKTRVNSLKLCETQPHLITLFTQPLQTKIRETLL